MKGYSNVQYVFLGVSNHTPVTDPQGQKWLACDMRQAEWEPGQHTGGYLPADLARQTAPGQSLSLNWQNVRIGQPGLESIHTWSPAAKPIEKAESAAPART